MFTTHKELMLAKRHFVDIRDLVVTNMASVDRILFKDTRYRGFTFIKILKTPPYNFLKINGSKTYRTRIFKYYLFLLGVNNGWGVNNYRN